MNKRRKIGTANFWGKYYIIELDSDYTLTYRCSNPGLDEAGFEKTGYEIQNFHQNPIRLLRNIKTIIQQFVFENRPPLIQFNSGMEKKREKIYEQFAKSLAKSIGYRYVVEDGYYLLLKKNI